MHEDTATVSTVKDKRATHRRVKPGLSVKVTSYDSENGSQGTGSSGRTRNDTTSASSRLSTPTQQPQKESPAYAPPPSPYLPNRRVGTAQRRAQRSPLLSVDDELQQATSTENPSPYRAPYIEEVFSPDKATYYSSGDYAQDEQNREQHHKEHFRRKFGEVPDLQPPSGRSSASPNQRGDYHAGWGRFGSNYSNNSPVGHVTDDYSQGADEFQTCDLSEDNSPSSTNHGFGDQNPYYNGPSTATNCSAAGGRGDDSDTKTHHEQSRRYSTGSFNHTNSKTGSAWADYISAGRSYVGGYSHWHSDEPDDPLGISSGRGPGPSLRSPLRTNRSGFASIASEVIPEEDEEDEACDPSERYTNDQDNVFSGYRPPFSTKSVFSGFGEPSEPRQRTAADAASWADGTTEDTAPDGNPYYNPPPSFASTSNTPRHAWSTKSNWEAATSNSKYGSRMHQDLVPEPIIEEPSTRASSPAPPTKLLEYHEAERSETVSPATSEQSTGCSSAQDIQAAERICGGRLLLTYGSEGTELLKSDN
ncbi:hypothetical protein B0I35DRAFT_507315 [Stachybotrys elegans]|uniref:Uncharacterized protein n=1 Tax=Stachybotrys elegans TaxID=80388 RepID=A0A8K0WXX7_9HYPO|nr:hypothetical protein B0I35DRAFT_507315 [Stachybotrys elegans]